jgi:Tol biopolymer transport system component
VRGRIAIIATVLATLQMGACGGAQPTGCSQSGGRPHPEIGGQLLYTCYALPAVRGGLYLLDVATGSVRPLTSDHSWNWGGAWSPDGSRIAFESTRQGRSDLYVMDVSDGRVRRLTNGTGFNESPRWSPDGSWISFMSGRSGVKGPYGAAGFHRDVYLMRPDGTDLRRLTSLTGFDGDATWSPDGSRIAFASDRGGAFDVFTMTSDGRDQHQLTHHDSSRGYAAWPSWSPDGSELVFNGTNPPGNSAGASIYKMPARGGVATRVTRGYDFHPDWSHDGSWIAFLGNRQGHTQLFAVRPDGSDLTQLTFEPGDKDIPRWRPG